MYGFGLNFCFLCKFEDVDLRGAIFNCLWLTFLDYNFTKFWKFRFVFIADWFILMRWVAVVWIVKVISRDGLKKDHIILLLLIVDG